MRISDWGSDVCSSDLCAASGSASSSTPLRPTKTQPRPPSPPNNTEPSPPARGRGLRKRKDARTDQSRQSDRPPGDDTPQPHKSEDRRLGKEWFSTFRSRLSPFH